MGKLKRRSDQAGEIIEKRRGGNHATLSSVGEM